MKRLEVVFTSFAKREYLNQLAWLQQHRGDLAADDFESSIRHYSRLIAQQPKWWPLVTGKTLPIRKVVIDKSLLLFYTIDELNAIVKIIAIRGAAEDWTNQSLPTD